MGEPSSSSLSSPVRSVPLTVITPMPRWKSRPGWAFLTYMRYRSKLHEVRQLRFIHFARWQRVSRRSLTNFANQPAEADGDDLFVFSTNFNGPWDQYIDTFSRVDNIRKGIRWLWGFSDKFPGPTPIRNFKSYIHHHTYAEQHYFDAYPDATVRDIAQALSVTEGLRQFVATRPETRSTDEAFARNYVEFLDTMADTDVPTGTTSQSFLTALSPIESADSSAASQQIRQYLEGRSPEPSPFADCPMVHMARIVVVDDLKPALGNRNATSLASRYLLFVVELDGSIGDFLDRLSDSHPEFVQAVWGSCHGFPVDRTGPVFFRQYIESCTAKPNLPFAAFPGVSVDQIRCALDTRHRLLKQVSQWGTAPTRAQWKHFAEHLGERGHHGY